MSYMNKSITELHNLLKSGEVTSKNLVDEAIKKSHELNLECNSFVTILDDAKESIVTDNLLSGIPFGVKDNYSTKDILSTGGSNTLKNYVPFYDATAIKKLKEDNAIIVCKTAMDEFGMGGTGTTCASGVVLNPWDKTRQTAGSSAGSACAVSAGVLPYALGSDTGDSIRKPAAYCGIVGYKPTYGLISRYGLFPFASSLDTCGVLTRNVLDAAIVVNEIKGIDENDMTSYDSKDMDLIKNIENDINGKKLFYIKQLCDINEYENPTEELKLHLKNFHDKLEEFKKLGISVDEVSIDSKLLNALPSTYVVISCAEATSNLSNLTGFIFGNKGKGNTYIESMVNHRTEGFNPLIKRRFVIGSYVLQASQVDRYFLNACRVRRLIVDKIKDLFKTYDGLIMPVGTGPAKKIEDNDDIIDDKTSVLEEHLQIANFGGFPSITIPSGFINNLPVGLNITCDNYNDELCLNIANKLESVMPYKNQIAKGNKNE